MMQMSTSISTLAAALAKAQAAISPALKDKTNPAFRSRYADLASVWEACREPLSKNGLSVVQMPVDSEPGRVALVTMLLHSSGEYMSSVVSAPLAKPDAQAIGSALTYLRRYALSAFVGVVADEDDDGNRASHTNGGATYQQPAPPQAPRPVAAVQPQPRPANGADAADARRKFYERWGAVAGSTWAAVQGYLGVPDPEPTTVEGWRTVWQWTSTAAQSVEFDALDKASRAK